jgi:hypothetical protein
MNQEHHSKTGTWNDPDIFKLAIIEMVGPVIMNTGHIWYVVHHGGTFILGNDIRNMKQVTRDFP